jgi:serpin B
MKRQRVVLVAMAVAMLLPSLLGCTGNVAQASVAKADVPRATAPAVAPSDLTNQVGGNNAFAFDLYRALKGEQGNLFYSPYSISLALAMTYGGARGQTEAQMAQTLHYLLSQDRLHPAFNSLDQTLASRGKGAQGQDDKGFRLKIANSVWGQQGYTFLPAYLELLAKNYGAGLRLTDFAQSPEPSRLAINKWVEEQTEGKIKDLLAQGTITPLTRMALVNAIYFNAAWQQPFDSGATKPGPFKLLDGKEVSVPMMSRGLSLPYAKGQGYQAVEIPYDGGEVSMVILLPDAGNFPAFEGAASGEQVSGIIGGLQRKQVNLTLPKFTFESKVSLKDTLKAMGITDAFTPGAADFSGMDGSRELYLSDVIHKAVVAVNEKGTEAAAATAAIVGVTSAPADPVTLTVDRPFLFLIRDVKTGAVLFVGRVLNPAG